MHRYVRRSAVATAALMLAVATLAELSAGVAVGAATCKGMPVSIVGTTEDDDLTGTPGDDVIRAYAGDDVIDGGGGNDVLCGDAGADELIGGEGDDALYGGPYKLYSDDGENAAAGDLLIGGTGNDRIRGGGTPSSEAVAVAPARRTPDRVEFPEARGGITVTADGVVTGPGVGTDQIVDVPHIVGTRWADHITVAGQAVVDAGAGGDEIEVVAGGEDLRLYPTLYGGDGTDRLDVSASELAGYWLYGGSGTDSLTGSGLDDFIGDSQGGGIAAGGGGNDQVDVTSAMSASGGPGDDTLQIALVTGRRGPLDGGEGADHAELQNGTSAPLTIDVPGGLVRVDGRQSALAGMESFGASARPADVRFIGGTGDERFGVVAWRGHTVRARMGGGDDYFAAYAAMDQDDYGTAAAWGGPGDDVFDGTERDDSLFGEDGDDRMYGDSGDDVLRGGPGDDRAFATRGESDSCTAEVERECER